MNVELWGSRRVQRSLFTALFAILVCMIARSTTCLDKCTPSAAVSNTAGLNQIDLDILWIEPVFTKSQELVSFLNNQRSERLARFHNGVGQNFRSTTIGAMSVNTQRTELKCISFFPNQEMLSYFVDETAKKSVKVEIMLKAAVIAPRFFEPPASNAETKTLRVIAMTAEDYRFDDYTEGDSDYSADSPEPCSMDDPTLQNVTDALTMSNTHLLFVTLDSVLADRWSKDFSPENTLLFEDKDVGTTNDPIVSFVNTRAAVLACRKFPQLFKTLEAENNTAGKDPQTPPITDESEPLQTDSTEDTDDTMSGATQMGAKSNVFWLLFPMFIVLIATSL